MFFYTIAQFQIAYSGVIHMKLAGLYLNRYQDDQDLTRLNFTISMQVLANCSEYKISVLFPGL